MTKEIELTLDELLSYRTIDSSEDSPQGRMLCELLSRLSPLVQAVQHMPEPAKHKAILAEMTIRAGLGLMVDQLGSALSAKYLLAMAKHLTQPKPGVGETLQ